MRAGDAGAPRRLMEMHGPTALRAAYVITRSLADAEDVVQEAFVKALGSLSRYERRGSFRSWLLRIVTNEALNQVRGRGRRLRAEARLLADRSEHAWTSDPAEHQTVWEAMAHLSEGDRAVIGCRFFLDLSQEEAAEVLGVPTGTVKSRQSAALERLRLALRETELEHADD